MRICLAASECAPLAKTGGLGDVTGALAGALGRRGHDVRLFLPFYPRIRAQELEILPVGFLDDLPVEMGRHRFHFAAHTTRLPGTDHWIYLLDCPRLFGRPDIYTSDPDEPLRFAAFSRAVIQACQGMGWAPQVFHLNDWHTALVPLLLREAYSWDRLLENSRTLLTIHNIAHQGVFGSAVLGEIGLAGSTERFYGEDLAAGRVNFLKTGLLYSDLISTVSPTYAREIQTAEFGIGLEGLLRRRSEHLVGILNGVDHEVWDPRADPLIPFPFDRDDLAGKAENRRALLAELRLAPDPAGPVMGIVSRLVGQKGFDLVFQPLPDLLRSADVRLVVLGTGEPRYEEYFAWLQAAFPAKVCFHRGFSEALAHRIEASSDLFLMPSRFEPCGLNQMYSLRYGTPPVVRKTGGLADSVRHFDRATGEGTGFVFEHFTPEGLSWALGEALGVFSDPDSWRRLVRNAMAEDFSWDRQVERYLEVYRALAGEPIRRDQGGMEP